MGAAIPAKEKVMSSDPLRHDEAQQHADEGSKQYIPVSRVSRPPTQQIIEPKRPPTRELNLLD
jgi:hypothetical protein